MPIQFCITTAKSQGPYPTSASEGPAFFFCFLNSRGQPTCPHDLGEAVFGDQERINLLCFFLAKRQRAVKSEKRRRREELRAVERKSASQQRNISSPPPPPPPPPLSLSTSVLPLRGGLAQRQQHRSAPPVRGRFRRGLESSSA
ncbi:hypothetical protein AOLI_G00293100 [Acnodon oligacanthus]